MVTCHKGVAGIALTLQVCVCHHGDTSVVGSTTEAVLSTLAGVCVCGQI